MILLRFINREIIINTNKRALLLRRKPLVTLIRMKVMSGNCFFSFVMKGKKAMRLEQQKRWAEAIAFQDERHCAYMRRSMEQ